MKKKKNKLKTKVCSRCKKDQPLTNFKNETRNRVSGEFLWIYPMCNDCSFKIKTKWGTNWIGGSNHVGEKPTTKNTNKTSIHSRRTSNKKVHIKQTESTVSESSVEGYNFSESIQRRPNSMPDKHGTGHIIKTLQKTKDYKEGV